MTLFTALHRWNVWGSWEMPIGYPRAITQEICRYLKTDDILALVGARRAGKSTILYQMIDYLIQSGTDPKAILHVNFEEPALSPNLQLALLDELYDTYRSNVYPKGKAYLFLDEIQNIEMWERWVRARNETESIKICLTGSSSALMSRELASVLTGRNLSFDIYPLSFAEILQFKHIAIPKKPWPVKAPAELEHVLNEYLTWGGFPKIVLAEDDLHREMLLKRYLDEIILKDVVMRHEIRDVTTLRNLAIHLLTHTACLTTNKRLADMFSVSLDLIQNYTSYLREAFLIETMGIYSLKASERSRHPTKIYAGDLGLRKAVSLSESADHSKQLETVVHQHLQRLDRGEFFYWQNKGKGEVDFLIKQANQVTELIQVAHQLDNKKTLERELKSLAQAHQQYPDAKLTLVTRQMPNALSLDKQPPVRICSLWQFLLAN